MTAIVPSIKLIFTISNLVKLALNPCPNTFDHTIENPSFIIFDQTLAHDWLIFKAKMLTVRASHAALI